MKIVEKHNFCFKQLEYNFNTEEISILEVVEEEVQIENDKVETVKEWKTPTKIKVESFLKFTNFYQYFIKNFSYMAKPLNELKKERVEIERTIPKDI